MLNIMWWKIFHSLCVGEHFNHFNPVMFADRKLKDQVWSLVSADTTSDQRKVWKEASTTMKLIP